MRSTYNISDARDDIKALNDFLVELGEEIQRKQADPAKVEAVMLNDEFSRLMSNTRFFLVDGNKYLAEIYASKARIFEERGAHS